MEYSTKLDTWYIPKPGHKLNGQFAKGCKPFNKGKKRTEWLSEENNKNFLAIAAKARIGKPNPNAGRKGTAIIGIKDGKKRKFKSIQYATEVLKFDRNCIVRVLRGQQKTTHGWFFKEL